MERYYTGIGSRKTPEEYLSYMTSIALDLTYQNFTLRSGAADGADTAFERGSQKKEIYLPWKGFNKDSIQREILPVSVLSLDKMPKDIVFKAEEIASRIHPRFQYLTYGAKRLHTRNVFQVLGQDLNTPSEVLICWTDGGGVTGGSATAIKIALEHEVPVFNLYNEVDRQAFRNWISASTDPDIIERRG